MRVKCLAQEHNTMSPARARTRSARSEVERANHEATAPPVTRNPTNAMVCDMPYLQNDFGAPLFFYIFKLITFHI